LTGFSRLSFFSKGNNPVLIKYFDFQNNKRTYTAGKRLTGKVLISLLARISRYLHKGIREN